MGHAGESPFPRFLTPSARAGAGAAPAGREVRGSRAQLTLTSHSLLGRHPLLGSSCAPHSQLLPSRAPSCLLHNRSCGTCLHSGTPASEGRAFRPGGVCGPGVAGHCWILSTERACEPRCALQGAARINVKRQRCHHSAGGQSGWVTQVSLSAGSHAHGQFRLPPRSPRSAARVVGDTGPGRPCPGPCGLAASSLHPSRSLGSSPRWARPVGAAGRPSAGGDGCVGPEISGRPVDRALTCRA